MQSVCQLNECQLLSEPIYMIIIIIPPQCHSPQRCVPIWSNYFCEYMINLVIFTSLMLSPSSSSSTVSSYNTNHVIVHNEDSKSITHHILHACVEIVCNLNQIFHLLNMIVEIVLEI